MKLTDQGAESVHLKKFLILARHLAHEWIMELVRKRGPCGATVHEIFAEIDKKMVPAAREMGNWCAATVSERLEELRIAGKLICKLDATGNYLKRNGDCVLVETQR